MTVEAGRFAWAAALCLALAAGCADPIAPGPEPMGPQPDDLRIGDVVFANPDRSTVAWSHGDHWHGALRVRRGEERDLLVFFVPRSQASHDAPGPEDWFTLEEHEEYLIHLLREDPTILRWTGDRHAGVLTGAYPGITRITVQVRRRQRVLFEAPPVPVVVVNE